jgi:hypothetical protein
MGCKVRLLEVCTAKYLQPLLLSVWTYNTGSREYWWCTEDQAFSPSFAMAPPPPRPPPSLVSKLDRRHTRSLTKRQLADVIGGGGGRGAKSQIIRRWESLVLYKSLSTFWLRVFNCSWDVGSLNTLDLLLILLLVGYGIANTVLKKHLQSPSTYRNKSFSIFPSPAGMSPTKLSLGGNNDVIYKLCPPRESLVSGDGNIEKLFLQCTCMDLATIRCRL